MRNHLFLSLVTIAAIFWTGEMSAQAQTPAATVRGQPAPKAPAAGNKFGAPTRDDLKKAGGDDSVQRIRNEAGTPKIDAGAAVLQPGSQGSLFVIGDDGAIGGVNPEDIIGWETFGDECWGDNGIKDLGGTLLCCPERTVQGMRQKFECAKGEPQKLEDYLDQLNAKRQGKGLGALSLENLQLSSGQGVKVKINQQDCEPYVCEDEDCQKAEGEDKPWMRKRDNTWATDGDPEDNTKFGSSIDADKINDEIRDRINEIKTGPLRIALDAALKDKQRSTLEGRDVRNAVTRAKGENSNWANRIGKPGPDGKPITKQDLNQQEKDANERLKEWERNKPKIDQKVTDLENAIKDINNPNDNKKEDNPPKENKPAEPKEDKPVKEEKPPKTDNTGRPSEEGSLAQQKKLLEEYCRLEPQNCPKDRRYIQIGKHKVDTYLVNPKPDDSGGVPPDYSERDDEEIMEMVCLDSRPQFPTGPAPIGPNIDPQHPDMQPDCYQKICPKDSKIRFGKACPKEGEEAGSGPGMHCINHEMRPQEGAVDPKEF